MLAYGQKGGKQLKGFAPEALRLLEMHSWPGNIRELENVIERAVITATGDQIRESDIHIERPAQGQLDASDASAQGKKGWEPGRTLDDIEKSVILEALQYHRGNRTHTAKALGISIRTLRNKLADYRRDGIVV
jgi:two-component system response regulator HydG